MITCTTRTVAEQQKLYAQGRTTPGAIVTQIDGVRKKSNHNLSPARAIDVAVLIQGKITWNEASYAPLGELAKRYGLVWGGSWVGFKDMPHLELPAAAASTAARGMVTPSGAGLMVGTSS